MKIEETLPASGCFTSQAADSACEAFSGTWIDWQNDSPLQPGHSLAPSIPTWVSPALPAAPIVRIEKSRTRAA